MRWDSFKHGLKWNTRAGKVARNLVTWFALILLGRSRSMLRWSAGRCSWCGGNPGFNSRMSRKGLRCESIGRDCTKF
jgi:hypothetical protein